MPTPRPPTDNASAHPPHVLDPPRPGATFVVERTLLILAQDDDGAAAAHLEGVGALLDALSQTSSADVRTELREAARYFERASRSHVRAARADRQALRRIAHDLVHAGTTTERGEDGGATAMVLCTLVAVVLVAVRWHSARGHAQQATAAHVSAQHLRAAYLAASARPMRAMRTAGRALPPAVREHHADTLRTVLPEATAQLLDDSGACGTSPLPPTHTASHKTGCGANSSPGPAS